MERYHLGLHVVYSNILLWYSIHGEHGEHGKKRLQKEIKTLDRSDLSEALYSALNITLSVQHYGQSISGAVKQLAKCQDNIEQTMIL